MENKKLDPNETVGGINVEMKLTTNIDEEMAKLDKMIDQAKELNILLSKAANEIKVMGDNMIAVIASIKGQK